MIRRRKPHKVTMQFTRTGDGPVLHFFPRHTASPEFVAELRKLGASEVTIAAAEGRVEDVRRLGKELAKVSSP